MYFKKKRFSRKKIRPSCTLYNIKTLLHPVKLELATMQHGHDFNFPNAHCTHGYILVFIFFEFQFIDLFEKLTLLN